MIIKGNSIINGKAIGKLYFFDYEIKHDYLDIDLETLLLLVKKDLKKFHKHQSHGAVGKDIINIQLAFLNDLVFINAIKEAQQNLPLFLAIENVIDYFTLMFHNSQSNIIKNRDVDLLDLKYHLLCRLANQKLFDLPKEDLILATPKLTPGILMHLPKQVKGIIVKEFPLLSHPALIARNLGIPIIEVAKFDPQVEYVKIDSNTITDNLSDDTHEANDINIVKYLSINRLADLARLPDYKGIGLVRTEYFESQSNLGSKPIKEYKTIIKKANIKPIYFRFYDASSDKDVMISKIEKRGIAYLLDNPALLISQANLFQKLAIYFMYFPYVDTKEQMQNARNLINFNHPHAIGAMIESKLGVSNLLEIASVADFIILGTNDLVADFFEIGRNTAIDINSAELYSYIEAICKECLAHDIHLGICGVLARSSVYLELFSKYNIIFVVE